MLKQLRPSFLYKSSRNAMTDNSLKRFLFIDRILVSRMVYPSSYNSLIVSLLCYFLCRGNISKQITYPVINDRIKKQINQKTCTLSKLARNKLYHDVSMKIVSILTKSSTVDYFPP